LLASNLKQVGCLVEKRTHPKMTAKRDAGKKKKGKKEKTSTFFREET